MFVCVAQPCWYAKFSFQKLHRLTLPFFRQQFHTVRGQRRNRHPQISAKPLNTDSLCYGVRDH